MRVQVTDVQFNPVIIMRLTQWVFFEVDEDSSSESISNDEWWGGQVVSSGQRVDPPLKITVP